MDFLRTEKVTDITHTQCQKREVDGLGAVNVMKSRSDLHLEFSFVGCMVESEGKVFRYLGCWRWLLDRFGRNLVAW